MRHVYAWAAALTAMVLLSGAPTVSAAADSRGWTKVSIFDFGLGAGTRSNIGVGRPGVGFLAAARGVEVAHGFKELGGAGIGTMVFEGMGATNGVRGGTAWANGMSSHGMPESYFPIYVYIPLDSSVDRPSRGRLVRSPFLCLEAGGSTWGSEGDYFRLGVSRVFHTTFEDISGHGRYTPVSFSLAGGAYWHDSYIEGNGVSVDQRTGFYLYVSFLWGGVYSH